MVPQTQRRTPPRHSPPPSTSTARPQARQPRASKTFPPKNIDQQSQVQSAPNANNNSIQSAAPHNISKIGVDQAGHMYPKRVSPASEVSSTPESTIRGSEQLEHSDFQPAEPPQGPSIRMPRNQFYAFGIAACPTRASLDEICRNFVLTRCYYGFRCNRVHPRDKATYRRKIEDATRVGPSPLSKLAGSSSGRAEGDAGASRSKTSRVDESACSEEQGKVNTLPDPSQSLLLSDLTNLNALHGVSESPESGGGWDPNGSWMPISKPEAWTNPSSSPATSNDRLFSGSSNSSTPTTASPVSSDDDREVKPIPIRRHPFNSVCVVFKRSGRCPLGDNCKFKHVREQVEPPPAPASQPSINQESDCMPASALIQPPVNTTPVQSMMPPEVAVPAQSTTPAATVRPPESQASAPLIRHPRPKTNEVCHKWLRNMCPYGYSCRRIHRDLEYDDEPAIGSTQSSTARLPSATPKFFNSMDEFLLSFTLYEHIRIQCSAGFDVQRIQTAFESSTLLVSNISSRVRPGRLKEMLGSYGSVEELYMPETLSPRSVVKVTYSDAAEAQKAQNALNGTKMYELTITARVAASGTMKTVANAILKDTSVRITWDAPAKEVYAGYSNREQALRALQIARTTPLNGHYLKGEIYEGMPVVDLVNVHFWGVPVDVDKADLIRFVNPVDIMWTRPNYTDFEDGARFIRKGLWACGTPEHFEILPPPYREGGVVRAWANFPTAAKAKEAARYLDGRRPKCLGLTMIRAKHVQTISYTLTQDKFAQFGAAIEALQESQRGSLTAVVITRRPNGGSFVRLSADGQKELAHLKHQFETILKGEVVRCDGKVVWDSYFKRKEGLDFLQDLKAKHPCVQFYNDINRQFIRLFGFSADRARFANAIIAKVKELRAQQKLEIALPGRLLGAAILDAELQRLRQRHGLDNAHIDPGKRVLYVRGDFMLFRTFKTIVEQIEQRLPAKTNYSGPTCPICFGEPTSPLRLQCGHSWCRDCVAHYLRSATEQRTFPVKCLGNEGRCGTKIPVGVAKAVLVGQELASLVDAAFLAHIQARPKEYRFCPSPDCPQVYRTTLQKATLQCPSCLTSICTRCHTEAHDGFQCADQVQDELFKKWMKEHDVKHCPTCNVPIERTEGCNHMTCTRCQTHICWQCMKTFPGGEGIYGHMREVHGTFGLGQIFD